MQYTGTIIDDITETVDEVMGRVFVADVELACDLEAAELYADET